MENIGIIDEVKAERVRLQRELSVALSTFERSDKVKKIKKEIKANQKRCPHDITNIICPYCGKRL